MLSFVSVLKFPLVDMELRGCALPPFSPNPGGPPGNSFSDAQSYLFFCELRLYHQVEQILLQRGTVKEAPGEEAGPQGTYSLYSRQPHTPIPGLQPHS